jgi:hypothetical protein
MVSIAEAERIRRERISKSRTRAAETRKRRSEAAAAAGAAEGCGGAHQNAGHVIIFDILCNIITYVHMVSYAKIMISLSKSLTMLRGVNDCLAPYLLLIEWFDGVYGLIPSFLFHTVGQ